MRPQHTRKTHPHIGHSVTNDADEFKFEILLKQVFLVHYLRAHLYEDLPLLESGWFKEVFNNISRDSSLLSLVIIELLQKVYQSTSCCCTNLDDIFITEVEEHRQELVIDSISIEKLCELAKVLCKDHLHSPFVLCLCDTLLILYELNKGVSTLWGNLSKEDM